MIRAVLFSPVARRLAHSSLGFHAAFAGLGPLERATLPDRPVPPRTIETGATLSDFDCIFVSMAWEPELLGLAKALRSSGLHPTRASRPPTEPLIIGGGPVTLSNPHLLAAVCDAVFVGEADHAFGALRDAIEGARDREDALLRLAKVPGAFVPAVSGEDAPPIVRAPLDFLPACTTLKDEPNEFGDAFLVEVGRGCPRACTFCVSSGLKPRFVAAEKVLAAVPEGVRRVGLVGAAVSDHPRLLAMVETFVARGCSVTTSSVRADRITPELLRLLAASGLRTLTVAADGPSEALRQALRKSVSAEDLERCADLAREARIMRLKIYVMVGLPGETGADILELGALVRRLSTRVRVALSVSPFVPKQNTPLASAPFAGVRDLKRRLSELRRAVGSAAAIRVTSPRVAELEYRLSHARGEELARHLQT